MVVAPAQAERGLPGAGELPVDLPEHRIGLVRDGRTVVEGAVLEVLRRDGLAGLEAALRLGDAQATLDHRGALGFVELCAGDFDAAATWLRPATEAYALLCARRARELLGATWGLGETGATGPSGNRYGDPAGHSCMAVAGPVERAITLQTGSAGRAAKMDAFARRALELLIEAIPES